MQMHDINTCDCEECDDARDMISEGNSIRESERKLELYHSDMAEFIHGEDSFHFEMEDC
jgi:hypothetical protein